MYSINKFLSKEELLRKVSSYDIFSRYCHGFESIGKPFHSPLRNDPNPSAFVIYYEGDLLFKDFGKGSYRAIDFVAELYNISFPQAIMKIANDFSVINGGDLNTTVSRKNTNIYPKDKTILKIKKREFKDYDYDYWVRDYKISLDTLNKFNVFPISHFTINNNLFISDKYSYSYDYYWEEGIFRRKIYQPFSKYKWFSNGGKIVQGEGMLPYKGDLLIITSSLKDVMVLYELGYTAIAPTTEAVFLFENYYHKQNNRFKDKVVFMDSDQTGIKMNIKYSSKFNIPYINIPEEYKSKDISDFVKNYSLEDAVKLIEYLLNYKLKI